ncbi:MAG TPA: sialate O-acetylesterase [Rariglobus sp.]|nr:sialate O-acetylesterase [Rariglobus sp.]
MIPETLRLPVLFNDHLILQRDRANPVWGWDRPGREVSVSLDGQPLASIRVNPDGRWSLTLPPLPAGGPHELIIEGTTRRVLRDVLVGEVWLCTGQSNMQFSVRQSANGEAEAATAAFPRIRLFSVAKKTSATPLDDVEGLWTVCSPETVREFSAVGFFFGRTLTQTLDVPVALIDLSWGGSPIEAWTALEDVDREPALAPLAAHCREFLQLSSKEGAQQAFRAWEKIRDAALADMRGVSFGWANPDFNDSTWPGCPVPGTFDEAAGEVDGAVWYRRTVEIPPTWAGRDLELHLGVIDDLDHTYWNGTLVGQTGTDTKEYYKHPRIYTVPGTLVKTGAVLLAVRVFDEYLSGGFVSHASDLWMAPRNADASERIPIAGGWKVKVEQVIPEKPWAQDQPQARPEGIFNAMLSPLIPFGIRGIIWYQGENNLGYAHRYAVQFPLMIAAWRRRWAQGDFPFLFVQLANYGVRHAQPSGGAWAELRNAQAAALRLPDTAMVTAIDVGAADNLHPTDKKTVGTRLASTALSTVYGLPLADCTGPVPERLEFNARELRVTYRHADTGLATTDDRPPQGFALVGADGQTDWAQARIEGASIVLSLAATPHPVKVKYAWADNPDVNLINQAGFPALPFRRDLPTRS